MILKHAYSVFTIIVFKASMFTSTDEEDPCSFPSNEDLVNSTVNLRRRILAGEIGSIEISIRSLITETQEVVQE